MNDLAMFDKLTGHIENLQVCPARITKQHIDVFKSETLSQDLGAP